MARKKALASAPTPTPDLILTNSGGAFSSPDMVLYERGNEFKSADGLSKMIFKGNKIECFGIGSKGNETFKLIETDTDTADNDRVLTLEDDFNFVFCVGFNDNGTICSKDCWYAPMGGYRCVYNGDTYNSVQYRDGDTYRGLEGVNQANKTIHINSLSYGKKTYNVYVGNIVNIPQ